MIPEVEQHCFCVCIFSFFFLLILISTMPLQGPPGWAEAGRPTVVWELSAHFTMSYRFRLKAHRSEVITTHTKSTHNDVSSVRKIGVGGKGVSTIVPASMVGGARRQSLGRAADCIAPCQAACPGHRSCSRSTSGRWAFDKPLGESSFLHRKTGCTEGITH